MENIEQIIQNSKTLKQLTRDISTIAKSSGSFSAGGSQQGKSGVTGINKVDAKIDDIKDAFANNTTVQFFKDPGAMLAKGFKGIVKPFTDIPGKIGDSLKNLNPFGGQGKANKQFKKLQEGIDRQTILLQSLVQKEDEGLKDEIKDGLAEGVGQTVIRDAIIGLNADSSNSLMESAKLRTRVALLGDQITGGFLKFFKINEGVDRTQKFFTSRFTKLFKKGTEEQVDADKVNNKRIEAYIERFGKVNNQDTKIMMRQNQNNFERAFGMKGKSSVVAPLQLIKTSLSGILNSILRVEQAALGQLSLEELKLRREEALDQQRREEARDAALRQEELFDFDAPNFGLKDETKNEKVDKGGIFSWIKENILGIGAGAVAAGTTTAVGGIGGFFTGLTAIMKGVGAALPFYLKGAASLSALALPIAAFGLAIPLLVKGLEGLTLEKLGLFAGLITTVGLIATGLGALIATGVGGLALAGGIAAIAALGLAIGGFGAGVALGEKGFNVMANFADKLSNIDNLGEKLAEFGGLGTALAKIGGGGLLSRFSSGPLDNVSEFLDKIQGNTLASAAVGLNGLAGSMERVNAIDFDTDFTKSFKDVASYSFRRDLGKAADGFKSFLQKVGEQLDKLDVSKLETLLATGDLTLQSVNAQGFAMESGQRALADNNQGAGGFVSVDNSTRSGNTNITNVAPVTPIVGDDTMAMVANTKVRHNG